MLGYHCELLIHCPVWRLILGGRVRSAALTSHHKLVGSAAVPWCAVMSQLTKTVDHARHPSKTYDRSDDDGEPFWSKPFAAVATSPPARFKLGITDGRTLEPQCLARHVSCDTHTHTHTRCSSRCLGASKMAKPRIWGDHNLRLR